MGSVETRSDLDFFLGGESVAAAGARAELFLLSGSGGAVDTGEILNGVVICVSGQTFYRIRGSPGRPNINSGSVAV